MRKKSRPCSWPLRLAASAGLFTLLCASSRAADIFWTNTASGLWNSPANWSPSIVPGRADNAIITAPGTYTVTAFGSASVASLTLGGATGKQKFSINAGTLSASTSTLVGPNGELSLVAGAIDGGDTTVQGTMNWSGGLLKSVLNIAPEGTLNMSGTGTKYLKGGTLVNAGTVVWIDSGSLEFGESGTIDNRGVFEILNNALLVQTLYTSRSWFTNSGVLRKRTATGTTSFGDVEFRNSGTVDVQSGIVSLASKTHSFSGNTTISGAGQFQVAGATLNLSGTVTASSPLRVTAGKTAGTCTINGDVVVNGGQTEGNLTLNGNLNVTSGKDVSITTIDGNLNISGGEAAGVTTIAGDMNLSGGSVTGTMAVGGNLNWSGGLLPGRNVSVQGDTLWTGGALSGKFTIPAGRLLTIPHGSTAALTGATLTNLGTIAIAPGQSLKCSSGAVLYNYGVVLVADGSPLTATSTDCDFLNFGTLRKTGANITVWKDVQYAGGGTIDVQDGLFSLQGLLTHTLNANASITGAGRFAVAGATLALGTNVTAAQPLEILDGTVTASGGFNGNIEWTKGSLAGALTVPAGRQIHLTGTGTKTFTKDSVLNVSGTALLDGNDSLLFFANATINNAGTFEIQTDGNFNFNGSDKAWFNNAGTLRKTLSTAALPFGALQLVNTGTLDLQAGDISLTANAQSLQNGSVIVGPGAVRVNGATLTLAGLVSSTSPVYLASGVLAGTATLTGPLTASGGLWSGAITVDGPVTWSGGVLAGTLTTKQTMDWSGGTISGTLLVSSGASLSVKSGGTRTLTGVLNNAGVVTVQPSAAITLVNGTPLVNSGLFEVQDEVPFKLSGSSKPVFNNSGTFRKTGSTRTLPLSFVLLQNTGTVDVQAGGIDFTLNSHTFANGSRLTGPGPVRIAGATITMDTLLRAEGPLELASGYLLGNATLDGNFAQSGGQLAGTVAVTGAFTWSGGEVKGTLTAQDRISWSGGWLSGTLNVPAACRFDLEDGDTKLLTGTLNNYGTLSLLALSQVQMDSGCVINNAGLCETWSADPFAHVNGGTPVFNNTGVFRKLGAGETAINLEVIFNNTGTLDIASNSLSFVSGTHTFGSGSSLIGAGLMRVAGATVNWNGAITNTCPIELASGILNAAGFLNGALVWSGGTLGGILTVAPGSEIRAVGTATKTLDSVTVTNLGAIILEGSGALAFSDDAILENNGLFELQAANSFTMPNGGKKWFNNRGNGILRKTGSTQPFVFSNVLLQNSGTLDIQAGSIDFTLNAHGLGDGTQVSGPGSIRIAGGTVTLAGSSTFSQPLQLNSGILTGTATNNSALTVSGGQFTGNLTVNGPVLYSAGELAGTLTASQAMEWSGGTISGTLLIPATTAVAVKPGGTRLLTGVLNNAGRVTVLTSAQIQLVSGTPFVNTGTFEVQDEVPFRVNGTSKPVFNNSGTFRKTLSTRTLALGAVLLQNRGTVDVQAGGIDFVLNTHTLAAGSRLTGPGAVRIVGATATLGSLLRVECPFELASGYLLGDATIEGSLAMSGGQLSGVVVATNAFTWSGGEVKGTLTANSRIAWSGGLLSGILNAPASCQLQVQDGANKVMTGTLNNYGRLELQDLVQIQMDSGCVINNAGLCETWAADPFGHVNSGISTFNNTGTFRKLGARETTISLDVLFNNSGVLEVASNTLSFISGTHSFSNGSRLTGAGITRIAGATVNWNGAITNTCPVELASGLLLAAGSINGAVTWSGGTLRGSLTVASASELHLVGTGTKTLQGITITNLGSVLLEGRGALAFTDDAIIQNHGLFELQVDNSFTVPNSGKKWLNNHGLLRKKNSTQPFLFSGVLLQNSGTLDILAGSMDFTLNGHGLNAGSRVTGPGSLRVDGATLTLAGQIPFSSPLQLVSGTLAGNAAVTGSLQWSGGTVPGLLTNIGSVSWSGGELSGTMLVNGTLDWSAGTLSGSLLVPAASQLTVSGSGNKILTGNLQNAGRATVQDSASIQLVSGTPLVNSGVFDLQSDTPIKVNGTSKPTFSNSGTLRRSASNKDVDFGAMLLQNSGTLELQSSGFTFSLNSHSFADGTRTMGAGSVRVSGATLNVNGTATLGAPFTLASGVLAGDATLNGTIALAGGTISGSFVLNGNSSWTGGELNGSVVANGTMNWAAGLLSGTLTIPASARMNVLPPGNNSISGVLQNSGTTVLSNNASIQLLGGTPIVNSGVLEVQSEQPFKPNGTTKVNFINSGTLRKTTSTKLMKLEYVQLQNSGTLDVQAGELSLALNTHSFADGTRTTGSGAVRVAGATLNLAGTITLGPALALDTGHLVGRATLNGPFQFSGGDVQDKLMVNGPLSWTGGLLKGGIFLQGAASWTGGEIDGWLSIATNSTLAIGGSAIKTIKGGTLTNSGLVIVSEPVTIQGDGGAVIQNFGGIHFPASVNVTTPWGGKPTWNNHGVLSLTNGFGVFNFPGDFSQFPSGRLELEIAGRDPGKTFNQIRVGHTATLNGTLTVRFTGDFTPTNGDRLEVLTFLDTAGRFAQVTGDVQLMSAVYSPSNVVLLSSAPVITQPPQSQSAIAGKSTTLNVVAIGTEPMGYQWLFNGTPWPGGVASALTLTNVQATQEGNYSVVISNIWGNTTSSPAFLTVDLPPVITLQPRPVTVNEGEAAEFTVLASGRRLRYQWKLGGAPISGATNATLVLTEVTGTQAGRYKVDIFSGIALTTSTEVILTVIIPPTITEQPASRLADPGSDVTFSVKATGTSPLSYQWIKDDQAIPGANQSSLRLTKVTRGQEGSYVVIVANAAGYDISAPAVLQVKTLPVITAQPVSQTVPRGTNVTFSVTATGLPAPAYQWRRNSINLAGATQPSLLLTNVQPAQSGNYSVAVENSVGTVESVDAELQIITPPIAFADNFAAVGILYTTNGFGRGTNCAATRQGGEPSHAGKGSATNSVWITWWAPANGIATFSTLGSDFDTVLAVYRGTSVNALTKIAADDDSAGFHCSKVSFNAQAGTYYQIAVAGVGGSCGDIILGWDLLITTERLPQITQAPLDITGNTNDTVALQVVFDAFEPTAIQWFHQGQTLAGATNSTYVIPSLQDDKVGGYAVRLTGASGRNVVSPPGDLQINTEGISNVSARNKFFDAAERALTP